ncbi:MAG: DNA polymerase I, partial [Campylobacterales bacterium]|nr:DNA polymerase I [Campylobacterales bacterium]
AWAVRKLYFKLLNMLSMQNKELFSEAESVEFPFVNTLIEIENSGIKIDLDFFEQLSFDSQKELLAITKEIYSLSGMEFNINSTQQLSHVLFDVLNLKSAKKTKTGFSTDEKVLSKLIDEHPIIEKLLDYRELFKLYSTYIEPLKNYALKNEQHKIYTTFLQTGTATGRLSSKNPNLQNIPVRSDIGKKIRHGFIADTNKVLIACDYSQIELRLLAHFSKDDVLVEAFNNNLDIHMQTAIKIFGENATKDKRDIAKSINFGLLYGMGSKKLSETINISQKEAKDYINSYFNSFPTVKKYIESIQEDIKQKGFVETLLKRRRYFDFASANEFLKSNYLREGVNTLFQGSAADLIKLSMNKIVDSQKEHNVKILLQIHDELIFECDKDKAKESAKILQHIMENIYKLDVPLKTSVNIANNWGDLK